MENQTALPASVIRWVDVLKERGLTNLALLLLDVIRVWGFVGGQLLWMVAPFFNEALLTPLAQTLEDPESFDRLRAYLLEGDVFA